MSYYLKKHWKFTVLTIVLAVVLQLVQANISLLMMQMFDALLALDYRAFLFWCIVELAVWGSYSGLEALRNWSYNYTVRKLNNSLRQDMAATLLHKSYADYHAQDKGEYLSWLTTGVDKIEVNAWDGFFSVAYEVSRVAANMLVLSVVHWSLVPLALLASAIMIFVPRLFSKKLAALGESCAQGQAAAVSGLKDLLGGYDVLRFFGRSARFSGGMEKASDQMEKPSYEQGYKRGIIQVVLGMVSLISQLFTILYCGLLIARGILSPSVLLTSGNLIGAVTNGLNSLSGQRLKMTLSKPYFDRIKIHAGDTRPEVLQGSTPIQNAITVENVCFRYQDKPVLENLSVTFRKGGKYAITGPSGCGKSTLLKLILGWLPDYGGTIRFDGRNARDYTPEQLQQQMSYIAQDVFLFNTTIRDNITLGGDFTDEQMEKALQCSALAGDLANMPKGLDTPVGEEGSSLSGGQRQRLAFARALLKDAPLLILDEPTAALDPLAEADLYRKYAQETADKTSVFISHRLGSTQFCHRVAYMEGGRITEMGSHQELLARGGAYAKLFEVQSSWYKDKKGGQTYEEN